MDLWEAVGHVLNFLWPSVAVAAGLATLLRWRHGRSWRRQFAALSLVGTLALAGGLWLLARDGAMLTYAVMLLMQATWAWWAARRA